MLLSDDAGGRNTLRETSTPGFYRGRRLTGQTGRRYTLQVRADGQGYAATPQLPAGVPLTGIVVQKPAFGGDPQLVSQLTDPAGAANSYVLRLYRNGRLTDGIFTQDDPPTDGKPNTRTLNVRGPSPAQDKPGLGDSARVVLQSVDARAYAYFSFLNQLLQVGLSSASPANPTSNFSGGALGYFSAYARRQRSVRVRS